MKEKDRPEFHDELSEAEFFGFAKSYLSVTFPNPQRIGCPPDADLQRMAEHPRRSSQRTLDLLFAALQPLHGNFNEPRT
jgi:hypothetical protein